MENENYSGVNAQSASKSSSMEMASPAANNDETTLTVSEDATKVKFTSAAGAADNSSRNGEAKLEIENVEVTMGGMGKDELMKYANDPFWVRLRWFFFILFWLAWAGMLAAAIAIVIMAPKCEAPPPLEYWQKGPVYQIYPRSFQDSDNDGVGDLKGIEQKLEYLADLGVNMIWISPFFTSPMVDFGYDISNFTDVDPIFGTMADFDSLIAAAKEKDLKIILDMVPNHSSDKHEWFQRSILREDPYTDYYIWNDGNLAANGSRIPPNNWVSVFGGSAWEWNEERQQFYYHQFTTGQPDLNYRNPKVVDELREILRFWLKKGIAGYRCDAVPHLFETTDLKDEPAIPNANESIYTPDQWEYYSHPYTWNLPEVFDIIRVIRETLQEFEDKDGEHRVMLTEAYVPIDDVMKYYGNETLPLADFPFNFGLIDHIKAGFTGIQLANTIQEWFTKMPSFGWADWVLGNHDNNRVGTRVGEGLIDGLHMVTLLLPGTPVTYYGEEIGMLDTFISYEDTVDPKACHFGPDKYMLYSRDPARTPFQWDDSLNAGFSTANKTWLPVNSNYTTVNVKVQQESATSHLKVYKSLVGLRKSPTIQFGDLSYPIVSEDVFSFTRIRAGSPGYLVALNVGDSDLTLDFSNATGVPAEATVELRSIQATNPDTKPGLKVSTNAVPVGQKEGIVLSFVPVINEA